MIVAFVCRPIITEFFWTKYKNPMIAAFVILDDRKCGESFTKADTISKNATVVFLKLLDNGERSVFLKIEQLLPDYALAKTCSFVRKDIIRSVFQKTAKNVRQRHEVKKLGRIFAIERSDIFEYVCSDIFYL